MTLNTFFTHFEISDYVIVDMFLQELTLLLFIYQYQYMYLVPLKLMYFGFNTYDLLCKNLSFHKQYMKEGRGWGKKHYV